MSAEVAHRLGIAVGVALAAGWPVWWLRHTRCGYRLRRRLAETLAVEQTTTWPHLDVPGSARGWLPSAVVACAGWLLMGGLAGVLTGLACAVGLWRWRLRQTTADGPGQERAQARAARQLPLAADLLAACIEAGAGPVPAAQAVGEALGGPVGEALARGAAEVRLGGEPGAAWRRLAAVPGAAALARLLERADVSGLPMAAPVARLAADRRAQWAREATAQARRAAVMVTAPVGLCFLPAFIAVGVLPVVIGLAGGVLGEGG